jgi:hypothetical protein
MRWQGPTSPVYSSHFTGSWVAIQHRGEQSLGKNIGPNFESISSRRSALRDAGYIFQVAHVSLLLSSLRSVLTGPESQARDIPPMAKPSGNRSYNTSFKEEYN